MDGTYEASQSLGAQSFQYLPSPHCLTYRTNSQSQNVQQVIFFTMFNTLIRNWGEMF
jgi:hypothetical protein